MQFAEFLQHHSLKRLSILYYPTCVGFGYGLYGEAISWNPHPCPPNPVRADKRSDPSLISRPTTINVVPIGYAFRPHLRGRLTLRRLTLRRNPWTFGDSVFHTVCRYSCQHSHFRYLQQTSQVTFAGLRNAPLPLNIAVEPASSVHGFSPVTFSAQRPSTSELLRFL